MPPGSGVWERVAPDDPRLYYTNYLRLHKDSSRAVFDRCFDSQWPCGWTPEWKYAAFGWQFTNLTGPWAEQQTPGATVAVYTNAQAARLTLDYPGLCQPSCPTSGDPGQCYIASGRGDALPSDVCRSNCVPLLYVDGVRRTLPPHRAAQTGDYRGVMTLDLFPPSEAALRNRYCMQHRA